MNSWLVITFWRRGWDLDSNRNGNLREDKKKIRRKESEESWTHYIERLEQYFLANEVDEVGKKRAILLSVCGSKTYTLARDLLQPVRPAEATFKKIVDTLDKHFSPRPSEIVERFKFHSRNRKDSQNIVIMAKRFQKCFEIG